MNCELYGAPVNKEYDNLKARFDIAVKALEEIKDEFEIDWAEAQNIATLALAKITASCE